MFAVKGWAVDASSLKPQTEPFKTAKAAAAAQNDDQATDQGSRKRKREQKASNTTDEDVGKLWERHIEGKEPAKVKKAKKEKKQKPEDNTEAVLPAQESAKATGIDGQNGEISKPTKAGRKDKAKKNKQNGETNGEHKSDNAATQQAQAKVESMPPAAPPLPATAKLTPMQSAMRQKLISARFRHLNETLYTAPSTTAVTLFDSNPEMFEDYHAGFRQQVSVWPVNPVDNFIATIRERGNVKQQNQRRGGKDKQSSSDNAVIPLPRTHGTAIIADLGCGDARLSQTLTTSNEISRINLKIHSFDLHSPSRLVTKADISNLPLEDGSVDVAIFCLALMGTNWINFIEEAYRILHWKGELWVAEIKSRFGRVGKGTGKAVEHSVGNKRKAAALAKVKEKKQKEQEEVNEQEVLQTEVDGVDNKKEETDVSGFVDVLRRRGFILKDGESSVDLGNKMFVKMEFIKAAVATKGKGVAEGEAHAKPMSKRFVEEEKEVSTEDETKALKPCLYKIR